MALKEGEYYITTYAMHASNGVLKEGSKFARFHRPQHVHAFWSSAMEQVERMRAKKIASLQKQVKKVQEKTFTEPE